MTDLNETAKELQQHEAFTVCSEYIKANGLQSFFDTLMNYSPHPALPILKGQARTLDKTDWEY
jgi:hypothetical protein